MFHKSFLSLCFLRGSEMIYETYSDFLIFLSFQVVKHWYVVNKQHQPFHIKLCEGHHFFSVGFQLCPLVSYYQILLLENSS